MSRFLKTTLCVILTILFAGAIILYVMDLREGKMVSAFSRYEDVDFDIIIDAGHGGADGGAVSDSGVPEAPINLAISLYCRDIAVFLGYRVKMTRLDQCFLWITEKTLP